QCWRCNCGPIYRPAVSGGYAGRASQNGERRWAGGSVVRHYEGSILIAAVVGAGRCFGWQPLAKVSMMIMRPPQQRQGRGSTRGPSAAAVSNVSACFERDGTASNSRARAVLAARLPLANNP